MEPEAKLEALDESEEVNSMSMESTDDDEEEDGEVGELRQQVVDLQGSLARSEQQVAELQESLAHGEKTRATLQKLLDERSAEVQEQMEAKQRLGEDIASYLRAAGARRGESSSEIKLLQTELRSARSTARAMAEDALELQLRYQGASSEAKEQSNKRRWLEKKLSKMTTRVHALEDSLRDFQRIHQDTVVEKQKFATELRRTKLLLAESELASDRLREELTLAQEKSDMISRQLNKMDEDVAKGAADLSALGPGQDARVTNLREKLRTAHEARERAGRTQTDRDLQTSAALETKAQEHRDEVKRMTLEVREADAAMIAADAAAHDPANDVLEQAEERSSPLPEELEDPDDLRAELRAGIREVDMQRQILSWAGVGLDEDASVVLLAHKHKDDLAQRAVSSLLHFASMVPIGSIGHHHVETLADTGIVKAYHNARTGKEPLKMFSPHLKGLPRLYTELEALTVHGYYTPEELKRRAKATATFQAMLRVKRALKAFRRRQREKLEHNSATTINSCARGYLGRKKARHRRLEVNHEKRQLKRAEDLARAERIIEEALGTDDDDDDGDDYSLANSKLRRANRSYRHMIRGLPVAAVAHLSANKKHGPLYAVLMQAVMGQRDYQRRLKKYKRLRNNGDQSGGWATLDDDDDSVSAQAQLRERIWQLESDVSALLLVDARRRLADRRQTLIDSNKGKAIAAHQKYAKAQNDSLSKHRLAQVGTRPTTSPFLTTPEPTYLPPESSLQQITDATPGNVSSRPLSTMGSDSVMSSRSMDWTGENIGSNLVGSETTTHQDQQLSGWSHEVTDRVVLSSLSTDEPDDDNNRDVRPVSRAISHVGCSPTLTQRLRAAQTARRATQGYRNATKNGPNAMKSVRVKDSLPVLEAAVQEAALAAGVHVSPRHADKTVGGQAAVAGKAAVQWQEWLRKEKGMKLELTPIGAAGLAHTLQQPGAGGIDRAEAAAAAYAKLDLHGTTAGEKIVRSKTVRRTPAERKLSPRSRRSRDARGAREQQHVDSLHSSSDAASVNSDVSDHNSVGDHNTGLTSW